MMTHAAVIISLQHLSSASKQALFSARILWAQATTVEVSLVRGGIEHKATAASAPDNTSNHREINHCLLLLFGTRHTCLHVDMVPRFFSFTLSKYTLTAQLSTAHNE